MFIGTVLGKVPANGKGSTKTPLENEWARYVETSRHGIKRTDKTVSIEKNISETRGKKNKVQCLLINEGSQRINMVIEYYMTGYLKLN